MSSNPHPPIHDATRTAAESRKEVRELFPSDAKLDARVRRTRDRLGAALVALIQEKSFDAITVQDVLDRAGVGRSTFYTHFRDTNDLFLSDADEFFEHLSTALSRYDDVSDRVFPVRELFEHVADMSAFLDALAESDRLHDLLDLARAHFARGIEQRLAGMPRASGIPATDRAALAHAHAGSVLSLMQWWIRAEKRASAAEMDALFHRTVWSGVEATGA